MEEGLEEATIRKVGVLSVANISGLINFFIGLIMGIFFVIMSFFLPAYSAILGFGLPVYLSFIILPIAYGILGFIGGAIGAFFYNISAKIAKGIKLYS